MNFFRRYLLKPAKKEKGLLDEIRATLGLIKSSRCWFESECDADLIEACVYQMEALEAKYRYLLKMAKRQGLECDAITGQQDEKQSA